MATQRGHVAALRTLVLSAAVIVGVLFPLLTSAETMMTHATASIPAGPIGDAIARGRQLVVDTRAQLPRNAGNGLNCSSCHLNGGTVAYAAPYVGLTGAFPEYRARSGQVISLQQRINACFQRSLDGQSLPWDSPEMNAILAYISWLSVGYPAGSPLPGRGFEPIDTALEPDTASGRNLYATRCASCHGANGEGVRLPVGTYAYPPVWGDDSFNLGAGMARTYTAAAFIRHNMPLGQGGTLSAQEAVDVAHFVTHQPRPDFPARSADWPAGGRPKDAR